MPRSPRPTRYIALTCCAALGAAVVVTGASATGYAAPRLEGTESTHPPVRTDTQELITLTAGAIKGSGYATTVTLKGHTLVKSARVFVYRAPNGKSPATLVAVRRASGGTWKAANVSLGGRSSAVFCARTGIHFSNSIRVAEALRAAGPATRSDVIYCN